MPNSNWSNLSPQNQDALRSLIRSIERSQGMFSLILVRCNFQTLRDQVRAALREQLQLPWQEITLTPQTTTLYSSICQAIKATQPAALMVNGLETVENLDGILRVTNQSREEFRNNFPCPLAIWINDEILKRLIRDATDFESWASVTIEFKKDLPELTQFVLQTADALFGQLLSSRENIFLDNQTLNLEEGSPLRLELRAACEELHQKLNPLPPEVEASGQFILGRVADNNDEVARTHYERSQMLWEQIGHWERYAHVQFYLGLWWGNYAVRHLQDQATGLQKARDYLQASIRTFEEIGQAHRVAQFINFLGEILLRQEDWSTLDTLASKAYLLHQRYHNQFRQAKALGFMAAVAIARHNWSQAEYQANLALTNWEQAAAAIKEQSDRQAFLNWEKSFHRPWYLYFLGTAQRNSNRILEATKNLEEARKTARPSYDPDLYTYILNELRDIYYFQQKDYLKAYKTRQERREVQNKFNLRPFIGPGRLHASQEITNPSLPRPYKEDRIAPEIEASGRYKDVEAILQRLDRKDFRLTVIYGPSGVGKSSILQAGLLPAVKQQTFDGRRVIPVLQQVYKNWVWELGKQLIQAYQEAQPTTVESPSVEALTSLEDILNQLRRHEREHFKTVLIFDQFEEFFFTNLDMEERYQFYGFAVECFKILDVEIILSMKEDYLHLLLVCNRLTELEIIENNILDKKILYYIGNFTKEETYSIVKNRIQNTRMTFEDVLVDQLVDDLVDTFGQVRPIELQIVGAQLQTQGITTLEKYQSLAEEYCHPKETLVRAYLEDVVKDCGQENADLAEIILYLLTSEDGTRPLRTKSELVQHKLYEALQSHPEQVDLILEIFVQAGLVLLVRSAPADSYQLVHDYLVSLIRKKVQDKHQKKIDELEHRVSKLSRMIRLLALLLVFLFSSGSILYLLYRNNKLLYEVTQLERDSVDNRSIFNGYEALSLEKAIRVADKSHEYPAIERRTTLPINTLQYILDQISEETWQNSEETWLDTQHGQIFAADIDLKNQRIATAGERTIKIWNSEGKLLKTLDLSQFLTESQQIWDVRFLPQEDRLAVINDTGIVSIWDTQSGTDQPLVANSAHQFKTYLARLILSPDQSVLVSAGQDGVIRFWNATNLELLSQWKAHGAAISSLGFSPDGAKLVSSGYDGVVRIWAVEANRSGTLLKTFPVTNQNSPNRPAIATFGLAISPDAKLLATASEDGFVRFWDLNSGQLLNQDLAHNGLVLTAITFIAPGENTASQFAPYQMLTADENGVIRSWLVDASKSVQTDEFKGHQGWVWNLIPTIKPSENYPLLISGSIDGTLRLWDLRQPADKVNSLLTTLPGHDRDQYGRGTAWSVSYSSSGQLLATAGSDGTAKIWQLADLQQTSDPPLTLEHRNSPVSGCEARENKDVFWVVFSPDEKIIATAGADCTVRLWRSQDGSAIATLAHEADAFVNSVTFSPNGAYLVSADSRGRLFLWNPQSGELLETLPTNSHPAETNQEKQPIFAVKFDANGKYLAAASEDGTVKLWQFHPNRLPNSSKFQLKAILPGHRNGATSVDFSRDGLIATAAKDGGVRIWVLREVLKPVDPKPIVTLPADQKRVTWVEFLKTGEHKNELLAAASKEGSVTIWDRNLQGWGLRKPGSAFKPRYQFEGHPGGAFSVTFLNTGKQIAVAQGNSQIKIWKLEDTPNLIKRGCAWLGEFPGAGTAQREYSNPITSPFSYLVRPSENDPEISEICRKY